jgi:hypothetical protein
LLCSGIERASPVSCCCFLLLRMQLGRALRLRLLLLLLHTAKGLS